MLIQCGVGKYILQLRQLEVAEWSTVSSRNMTLLGILQQQLIHSSAARKRFAYGSIKALPAHAVCYRHALQ